MTYACLFTTYACTTVSNILLLEFKLPMAPQSLSDMVDLFNGTLVNVSAKFNLSDRTQIYSKVIIKHAEANWDDATWILTSAFIIFTMQSGFGLLESGSVTRKNEVNIMVKNAVDVLFGGLSYWAIGFGLSFGEADGSNPFLGVGRFFVHANDDNMGLLFSSFFFHTSFATTATTIVSGAMAERTKLESYILFSFFNTLIYSIPTHWLWASNGWLKKLGVVDIAGAGSVHLTGGVTGLIATLILKPRTNRFEDGKKGHSMGSPTNAMFGMFVLWWGWLGFNCGSTYGITGGKWKLAARSAVSTITSSIAGGLVGISLSYVCKRKTFDIAYLINGVLASLVSITAFCALAHPWQSLIIGAIGSAIANLGCNLMEKLRIDDPVGVVPVHAFASIWSLLTVGLFARVDEIENIAQHNGLFYGGGLYMLGVQILAIVSVIVWTLTSGLLCLKAVDLTVGLRVPLREELLGADLVEHSLNGTYDKATGELRGIDGEIIEVINSNVGDELDEDYIARMSKLSRLVVFGLPSRVLNSIDKFDNKTDFEHYGGDSENIARNRTAQWAVKTKSICGKDVDNRSSTATVTNLDEVINDSGEPDIIAKHSTDARNKSSSASQGSSVFSNPGAMFEYGSKTLKEK
ncbi:putative ammonium transporter 3 [Glandiceps talaboti]